jgi:serine/threonine-protein kinase
MVTFDGAVKIIDFGVARAKVGEYRTKTGMLIGTLRYLSPEQALAGAIDGRSDLYTLSVVLYEMLSGQPVIEDGEMSPMIRKIVTSEVPSIRHLRPEVPEDLAYVLARGLKKDRDERWPDATAYLDAIRAAAGRHELGAEELGARMRGWFPEQERRAKERIEAGRRRFEAERSVMPEQLLETRAVERVDLGPRARSSAWYALPIALLAVAAIGAALVFDAEPPAPAIAPSPPPPLAEAPTIVPRPTPPAVEPVEDPPPPEPPTPPPKIAPRKVRRAMPDVAAVLAKHRLSRADLEHQHSLDRVVVRLASSDPAEVDRALRELEGRLVEIDFRGERLERRAQRIGDLLKRTSLGAREFREMERRLMAASERIRSSMEPARYRELCRAFDELERDLTR